MAPEGLPCYDLGEFNVVKEGPETGRILFVDGTILEADLEQCAIPLALAGNTCQGALHQLREAGFHVGEEDLGEMIEALAELELVQTRPGPPRAPYCRPRALANLKELERGAVTLWEAAITLNNACPMRCSFCFRKDFGLKVELGLEDYRRLNASLERLGCTSLNISGGEPSLVWRLVRDVAQDARSRGIQRVSVNTTGFLLREDILARWRDAGLGCLNLALDSAKAEIHDRALKKPGAWEAAVGTLRAAHRVGLPVHVNCTVFGENAEGIEELIEFAFAEGATWVRINPYVPQRGNAALSPEVNWRLAETVARARERGLGVYTPVDRQESFPDFMICSAGLTKAVVEVDGSVGGCQFLGNLNGPGANIRQADFFDIWTAGRWDWFREQFPEIGGLCKTCLHRPYCVGNCLAMARSLFGEGKLVGYHECQWYVPREAAAPAGVA